MVITQNDNAKNKRMIFVIDQKLKSEDLFKESKEIGIIHNEEVYKLRLTANQKLILTK